MKLKFKTIEDINLAAIKCKAIETKKGIKAWGPLKGPNVEIEITATPEAWEKLQQYYKTHSEDYADISDFIYCARAISKRKSTRKKNFPLVQILKLHAALIYESFYNRSRKIRQTHTREFFPNEKLIKKTAMFLDSVWREEMATNKLKLVDIENLKWKSFFNGYIADGQLMIVENYKTYIDALLTLRSVLFFKKYKKDIADKKIFDEACRIVFPVKIDPSKLTAAIKK